MKVLVISRAGLELARAHLHRPNASIGRSPTCDVILRAPGVAPIHFLLEWIGTGEFNSSSGRWAIFDVASSADDTGEGMILQGGETDFGGFRFKWVEDALQDKPELGGSIRSSLVAGVGGSIIELIQCQSSSGSIQDIVHLTPVAKRKPLRPLRKTPQFQLQVSRAEQRSVIHLLLEEMAGAKVFKKGAWIEKPEEMALESGDLLEIKWEDLHFYLRLVPVADVPHIKREVIKDPLLFKLTLGGFGFAFLALLLTFLLPYQAPEDKPLPPPRIAKIEVHEPAPPAPPAPVPPPAEPKEVSAGIKQPAPPKKAPAAAAAPRFESKAKAEPKKVGLNSPAEKTDVNTVGILGALKKSGGPKGPGVRADRIMNDSVVTQSVSGSKGDVLVTNPPSGVLGSGTQGGSPKGDSNLASASTSLGGGKGFDPKSAGPIGRDGGKSGLQAGNSLGKDGDGVASGLDIGKLNTGGFEVSGGLDRETVRRVINNYRSLVRTCYEKALLSNPNLGGRIVYTWVIAPEGGVVSNRVTKSDVKSPQLEACVDGVIRSMKFPSAPNKRSTTVIYPYVFQSKS